MRVFAYWSFGSPTRPRVAHIQLVVVYNQVPGIGYIRHIGHKRLFQHGHLVIFHLEVAQSIFTQSPYRLILFIRRGHYICQILRLIAKIENILYLYLAIHNIGFTESHKYQSL